jgi:CRP-like cAMP-binding protein
MSLPYSFLSGEVGSFSIVDALEGSAQLVNYFEQLELKRNAVLFSEGDERACVYIVKEGLLRAYSCNEQDQEVNLVLFDRHSVIANLDSIVEQGSGITYTVSCVEDSVLYGISYEKLCELALLHPAFAKFIHILQFQHCKSLMGRIRSLMLLEKEALYMQVMREMPDLSQRIPLLQIASFIGVTPVSLSRIRSRLARSRNRKDA